MSATDPDPPATPTAEEAMHTTLDLPFEEAVLQVQLEHEFGGFETVQKTRLDEMVRGAFDEAAPRTALLVICHAEIARDALAIDPTLAGLLPCTTVVYEDPDDDAVHVHHVSATKAIRDLGCAPADATPEVQALVETTGEHMERVWENVAALDEPGSGY
jgi:uncharacterized protein (DUF302 family)